MSEEMKTVETHIAETKHKAAQLLALLNDPHPGLSTWIGAVKRLCLEIGACAKPDEAKGDHALARAYVRAVLDGRPHSLDLDVDWSDVREQARTMLADSGLRGRELIDKLDMLDDLLQANGHYEQE